MCNRYRLKHSKQDLAERFDAFDEFDDHPRYNIAPTQPVLTVRKEQGKKVRHFTTMRWGLIPSWAKYDPVSDNGGCDQCSSASGCANT